jgi:cell division topological specificity factor
MMVGFLDRLFGRDREDKGSGKVAKDRLQLVLVRDRINLPTEKVQQMEREIIEVISKYVSVDLDNVDFSLSNRDRNGLLVAEIPFIAVADGVSEAEDDETVAKRANENDDTSVSVQADDAPETSPKAPRPVTESASDDDDAPLNTDTDDD